MHRDPRGTRWPGARGQARAVRPRPIWASSLPSTRRVVSAMYCFRELIDENREGDRQETMDSPREPFLDPRRKPAGRARSACSAEHRPSQPRCKPGGNQQGRAQCTRAPVRSVISTWSMLPWCRSETCLEEILCLESIIPRPPHAFTQITLQPRLFVLFHRIAIGIDPT